MLVDHGPDEWQRIDVIPDATRAVGMPGESGRQVDIVTASPATPYTTRNLEPVTVSNVKKGTESISFTVDKIGVPVLVKVSYFPNWKASGASGVYRAAPNMMVVVPTSKNVTLSYEASRLDSSSYVLTLMGIVMAVFMYRRRFRYGVAITPVLEELSEDSSDDDDVSDNLV